MKLVGPLLIFSLFWGMSLSHAQNLNQLLGERFYLRVSDPVLETEDLRKLYQLNGYANFWKNQGVPNPAARALREILKNADEYGLNPSQYWNQNIEKIYGSKNERNATTLELLLSDAYFRFVRDLTNGQIQAPDLIDEDIKMPVKAFDVHAKLVEFSKDPERLRENIESLAPQSPSYKKLVVLYKRLKTLEAQRTWGELVDPGADIKPGQSHNTIPEIKKRLNDLGYPISNRSVTFDEELQAAYKKYQVLNRLPQVKNLSRTVYASLKPSLSERMDTIRANLEKFRWFASRWENRYLMVNLAFQELNIFENDQKVLTMKTVNGRPTRRTPTLRDEIRFIELNPTWTVPSSIARRDKLDLLQNKPAEFEKMNFYIYRGYGSPKPENQVGIYSENWFQYSQTNFPFTLVQQPGRLNALGVVKFPLTNGWFIYMHDTNEPHLMNEFNRQRSSGCVRLEKPFELAQYLLRDQPEWTLARMKSVTQNEYKIFVKQNLPVYFLYQTVDVTDAGEVRFAFDDYGQDKRLIELFNTRGSNEKF